MTVICWRIYQSVLQQGKGRFLKLAEGIFGTFGGQHLQARLRTNRADFNVRVA